MGKHIYYIPCLFKTKTLNMRLMLMLTLLLPLVSCEVTCRDENGHPVDWFIIYKAPRLKQHPDPLFAEGIGYFYMDAKKPEFKISDRNLSTTNTAIGHTLADVYTAAQSDSDDVGYMLYNDQTPDHEFSLKYGHTKGDLALDSEMGWWLIHSLPRFPNKGKDGYSLHSNAHYMGQTFLCLSLDADQFTTVGRHLMYTYPWNYDFRIPSWMESRFPDLAASSQGEHVRRKPYYHLGSVQTRAGVDFKIFGKYSKWGKDIYHDLVAPSLGTSLNVETWRRDHKYVLTSNCSGEFDVYNVEDLDFHTDQFYTRFSYFDDHSKWAVSETKSKGDIESNSIVIDDDFEKWTCIGGINRESTQFKRAGATVCNSLSQIWEQFDKIITHIEPCP